MSRALTASRVFCLLFALLPTFVTAQSIAGGESGFDTSLEAIEPQDPVVNVGLGGSDPANIARYLLASNGGARAARLSPDGSEIAFNWAITGEPQVWVMAAEGGFPRRLTYGNGISFFRWSPDGDHIIYGADNDGNEQEAYFMININSGAESLVMPAASGGFRRFGEFVGDNAIAYASTERNRLDFDIYLADLDYGTAQIVFEGTYGFFVAGVSPDGAYAVIAETVGEDSDNLYLLELATGEIESLSSPARRANHTDGRIVWTEDSAGFYLASNLNREFNSLMYYSLTDGFELVEDFGVDVSQVSLCGDNDRYMVWLLNEDGFSRIKARDM